MIEAMAHPLPDKPSIAVLPFANMSDDPQQAYFADGMTEDLITGLAKISGLFVISRNSILTYKDKPVKIRTVAEELGVRYVLEGSVRRFGDELRITGQLIDATTGGHLWAESYDGTVENVFAFQDQVRARIIDSLSVVLTPPEKQALADSGTVSVEAYDSFLKGMALLPQAQFFFVDPLIEAKGHFETAIDLDPAYWRAMAALAWCEYLNAVYSNDASFGAYENAFAIARKSIELKESPLAYVVLAKEHFRPRSTWSGAGGMGSGYRDATELLERAVALEPGNADVVAELAYVLVYAGDIARAAALMADAKRLNPTHPIWYRQPLGMVNYFRGDYEAAIVEFRVWRDAEAYFSDGGLWLAAAQAMSGKTIAAKKTLEPFRQRDPNYTTLGLSGYWNFADSRMWAAFEKGLIAAGFPPPPE